MTTLSVYIFNEELKTASMTISEYVSYWRVVRSRDKRYAAEQFNAIWPVDSIKIYERRHEQRQSLAMKTCNIPDCDKKHSQHGLCIKHTSYAKIHNGNPFRRQRQQEWLEIIIRDHIDELGDECYEWPYKLKGNGYGSVSVDGKLWPAHRYALTLYAGPAPAEGLHAAHSCNNPPCINPNHLRWATVAENMADRIVNNTNVPGVKNGQAKLTEAEVIKIRHLLNKGESQLKVGKQFGISQSQIGRIHLRETWAHIQTVNIDWWVAFVTSSAILILWLAIQLASPT